MAEDSKLSDKDLQELIDFVVPCRSRDAFVELKSARAEIERLRSEFGKIVIANAEVAKLNAEQAETIQRLRAALKLTTNRLELSESGWITDERGTIAAAREALRGADETAGEHPLDEWLVPTTPEETSALTRAALTPCTGCNSTPCVCEELQHEP